MSLSAALLLAAASAADPTVIAGFESLDGWQAQASDGVEAAIESVPGATGKALRLDYDFHDVSGYAFARRALPVAFPENYELSFRIRGTPRVNDLQIKFVDASGDNVWWTQQVDFRPSEDWQTIRVRRRDVTFAWGPTDDRTLRQTASLELVVVRGRQGGAGHIEIDDLTLTPLPANPPELPAPLPSDRAAFDGDDTTAATITAAHPFTLDFGGAKEFGGLTLRWRSPAPRYTVEAADRSGAWRTLRTVTEGDGGDDPIALGEAEYDRLRVRVPDGVAALAEAIVQPPEWGASPTAMVSALAAEAPRGSFPRGFTEQPYWTLVGPDGGPESGLISEDGAVEVAKGGFTIEPFVGIGGRRYGWADVEASQSLEDGYLPIPSVRWAGPGFALQTTLVATNGDAAQLIARYRLANLSDTPQTIRLTLAIRPYQVNPPAQFLSQKGGVSPIARIVADENAIFVTALPEIDGDPPVMHALSPGLRPDRVVRGGFDSIDFDRWQSLLGSPASDAGNLASAAMIYDFPLAPGEIVELPVAIPLTDAEPRRPTLPTVEAAFADTAAYWRERLGAVTIELPEAHRRIADTIRTATAHMLMSRNGPMLKPGTRSYNRSWIRDGAMISDGLLRLGIVEPVADYADWYSGYLFDSGKVPCCVDYRGADPVPENDSHGQYIHLLTQLYRYTGDRARLDREWPKLSAALGYVEGLRQSQRTEANRTGDGGIRYGLMPPSISHEGYSAKAQYSLWDDFWALRGYKDAAFAAEALGKPDAAEIAGWRDQFAGDIRAAIAAAARHWDIDYIPGATSLGDLDATSTTMAFDPAGEAARLDPALLTGTFEAYWRKFVARRDGTADWDDYTPYELRNVSAFVRLGWRARAAELLGYFFDDRRPEAWNGWAEVVGRDPREIRFIGDMPHAWVASDYLRSALDLFAYERQDDGAVILAAGLTADMLEGDGARIAGLRTPYGAVSYHLQFADDRLVLEIDGDATPPGGYLLPWPLEGTPVRATIDGREMPFAADGLHIAATGAPIRVEIRR